MPTIKSNRYICDIDLEPQDGWRGRVFIYRTRKRGIDKTQRYGAHLSFRHETKNELHRNRRSFGPYDDIFTLMEKVLANWYKL